MTTKIRTSDLEIFSKFNSLKFTNEVVIHNKKQRQITKILNNINRKNTVIKSQHIGNRLLLRRVKPLQFNMYYMKR